ncbi:MAG: hypothetical protein AABY28_00575 [Candidatus Omnitrophota bacterium]
MKRKINLLMCVIVFLICLSVTLSYSQEEQITVTTYYPSPYGSYNRLQANRNAIGDTNNDGQLTSADQPANDGDLLVRRSIAIGTLGATPNARLDVRVTDATRPTNLCVRRGYTDVSGTTSCPSGYYIALGSYATMVTPPLPGYIICCQACIDNDGNGVCD